MTGKVSAALLVLTILPQHLSGRLHEINSIEGSKSRKEEAKKELESYLHNLRDPLGDESETPFGKYAPTRGEASNP